VGIDVGIALLGRRAAQLLSRMRSAGSGWSDPPWGYSAHPHLDPQPRESTPAGRPRSGIARAGLN
jgi:hypothetical protein